MALTYKKIRQTNRCVLNWPYVSCLQSSFGHWYSNMIQPGVTQFSAILMNIIIFFKHSKIAVQPHFTTLSPFLNNKNNQKLHFKIGNFHIFTQKHLKLSPVTIH